MQGLLIRLPRVVPHLPPASSLFSTFNSHPIIEFPPRACTNLSGRLQTADPYYLHRLTSSSPSLFVKMGAAARLLHKTQHSNLHEVTEFRGLLHGFTPSAARGVLVREFSLRGPLADHPMFQISVPCYPNTRARSSTFTYSPTNCTRCSVSQQYPRSSADYALCVRATPHTTAMRRDDLIAHTGQDPGHIFRSWYREKSQGGGRSVEYLQR